jgi:hypothetical protein
VVPWHAIDGDDQIVEEAAILCRHRALVTLQGKLILLLATDVPGLGHILAMLAHTSTSDTILNLRDIKSNVGRPQPNRRSIAGSRNRRSSSLPLCGLSSVSAVKILSLMECSAAARA